MRGLPKDLMHMCGIELHIADNWNRCLVRDATSIVSHCQIKVMLSEDCNKIDRGEHLQLITVKGTTQPITAKWDTKIATSVTSIGLCCP